MTGISTGLRTGSRFGKFTRTGIGLNQASYSVWQSLPARARLALSWVTLLACVLLVLTAAALPQVLRLDQSPQIRRLEKPAADFLHQICSESHLEVVQVSPLRVVVSALYHEDSPGLLQSRLRSLYNIQESRGDQLVLMSGPVPFYWVDHPQMVLPLGAMGCLLFMPGLALAAQHLVYLRRRPRPSSCSHRSGRLRRWLGGLARFFLWLTPLATLAGVLGQALPPLTVALNLLVLFAWRWRRRRASRLRANPSDRPIVHGLQEAAIILMSYPPEFSAKMFVELGPDQVHAITREISQLPPVSPELRSLVLGTFQRHLDQMCQGSCPGSQGGPCDPARMSAALLKFYLNSVVQGVLVPPVSAKRRRIYHWTLLAVLAAATGACLGTISVLSDREDSSQRLRHELERFISADPLLVAVVERDGQVSTMLGLGMDDVASLPPLLRIGAEKAGLDPSRVSCVRVHRLHGPGWPLPTAMFLGSVVGLGLLLRRRTGRRLPPAAGMTSAPKPPSDDERKAAVLKLMAVDELGVDLGRNLTGLVDPAQGGKLLERVQAIRRHIALERGFLIPGVCFRDNLTVQPNEYLIRVRGREVARGTVKVNQFLAIGPEAKLVNLRGDKTIDPTYGMPGVWISPEQRGDAERLGCMNFDPVSVVATQLTEVIRTYGWDLFTFTATSELLDQNHLRVVMAELQRRGVDRVLLWKVLRLLVSEKVNIADLPTILDGVLAHHPITTDPEEMVELVRYALRDSIVKAFTSGVEGEPAVHLLGWRLTAEWEELLSQQPTPEQASELMLQLHSVAQYLQENGRTPLIITSPGCRRQVRDLMRSIPDGAVLSTAEIPSWAQLRLIQPSGYSWEVGAQS